ncbi:MAG TPA: arabinofuranosidase catalytic domain-containing protein [Polyangiaceae bacterium]|jgi:hypothetical protein|nr:arabinofuranosidase catalytic domain-containing protein [Polyangiaceae bacterium]
MSAKLQVTARGAGVVLVVTAAMVAACSSETPADGSAGHGNAAGSVSSAGKTGAGSGGTGSALGGHGGGGMASTSAAGGTTNGGAPIGGSAQAGTAAGGSSNGGAVTGGGAGTPGGGLSSGGRGPGLGGRRGSGGAAGAGDSGAGGQPGSSGAGAGGAAGSGANGGPCDIYATGDTPCVAAHSTVRALYSAYTGNLYQVRRADKMTKDIGVVAGGFADSAAQDTFCANTTCTISILYDQSPKANHLKVGPEGGAGKADVEANATGLKLNVGGHPVYAVFVAPGTGYRNNQTAGIATGDQPEGLYMVTSGTHYNSGCCFDYGNAETNNKDTGNGHMEAIYFGNCTGWGKGAMNGPWVMADLENGLFAGQTLDRNNDNTPLSSDYVTAMVKGKAGAFAIRGGNAQSGSLKTLYDGGRPTTSGYNPMHKEGAIILGIGGDNSNASAGTFFEGCITAGYPSAAIEDAVQANIVAAGYGK